MQLDSEEVDALTSISHVPASSPANFRKVSYDAISSFQTVPCLKSVTCRSSHALSKCPALVILVVCACKQRGFFTEGTRAQMTL